MISGTRIGDIRKSRVQKSTGTNNSSSKFYATIENFAGKNKDKIGRASCRERV